MIASTSPPHGWSSDHQGISTVWPLDWPLDVSAPCRQAHPGQAYAAGPEIMQAMQAILTAEHIAKIDRQLGAPQAPACDATSNVSSSSHVNDLLFTNSQPSAVQQSVGHARPDTGSVQPARTARGSRSPVGGTGAGRRPGGLARQSKPAPEAPTAQGLDALAACAAMLCGEADPLQPRQRVAARPGDVTVQVCYHAALRSPFLRHTPSPSFILLFLLSIY